MTSDEMKQVIVLRGDIKISCGKAVAQGAHASVSTIITITSKGKREWKKWLDQWLAEGQKKIVLKARNEEELEKLYNAAKAMGLPASIVIDAGRTELPPGTRTAIAIGPAPSRLVDRITGSLPLYR